MRRFTSAPKPSERVRSYISERSWTPSARGRSGRRRSGRGCSRPRPWRSGSRSRPRSACGAGETSSTVLAPARSSSATASRTASSTPGRRPPRRSTPRQADHQARHVAVQGLGVARHRLGNGGGVQRDRGRLIASSTRRRRRRRVRAKGADLVRGRGEGHQAPARDPPVGGLQPDDAAEGGRLPDRAAGVAAQGSRHDAGRHRRGRAPGRTARVQRSGPRGCAPGPAVECSVEEPMANSSMLVRPTITAPAALSFAPPPSPS